MNYTIYIANGQILRTVSTSDIQSQIGSGELFIEGSYIDTKYMIINEVPQLIPQNTGKDYYVFDFDSKTWVDPLTPDQRYIVEANNCNLQRNKLLYESDWTQIPNGPLSVQKQQEWADYRQQLRDITSQPGYPFNVVWPTKPE